MTPDERDRRLHRLIDHIYDAVEDPARWPPLLEALDRLAEAEGGMGDDTLHLLGGHLRRALRLHRRLEENHQALALGQELLDRLPLAIFCVDASLRVLTVNRTGADLCHEGEALKLQDGALRGPHGRALEELVGLTLGGDGPGTLVVDSPPLTLLAIAGGEASGDRPQRCLLVAARPGLGPPPSPLLLGELFGLSPAEARLTARLLRGDDLEAAARALHVSPHTARTQLKAVFAKTDTHRQPELIRHILTSPALLSMEAGPAEPRPPHPRAREGRLTLPDGRVLSFCQYGDANGTPVVFLHSIVGSRAQIHPDPAQVDGLGIRWICPDRPGYGHSDPQPGRTLLDWADDLTRLADHLELEAFHLAGHSAGGAFACAFAFRRPERVRRMALVSPMAPFERLRELDGMPPTNRMLLSLARHAPRLLTPFMRLMVRGLAKEPEQITHRHAELWPEADRRAVDAPGRRAFLTGLFRQATRQGPEAIVQEQVLLARPWGFPLEAIGTDTRLWHGENDIHVPLSLTRAFDALPHLTRHTVPGAGHYLYLSHWRTIFTDLLH